MVVVVLVVDVVLLVVLVEVVDVVDVVLVVVGQPVIALHNTPDVDVDCKAPPKFAHDTLLPA